MRSRRQCESSKSPADTSIDQCLSEDAAGRTILTRDSLRQFFSVLKHQQKVMPKMTPEAAKVLLQRFNQMQQRSSDFDGEFVVGV